MALVNLNDLASQLMNECNERFVEGDYELPDSFKNMVTSFVQNGKTTFFKYSFVIDNDKGQKVYLPNQLIYRVAFFAKYLQEQIMRGKSSINMYHRHLQKLM